MRAHQRDDHYPLRSKLMYSPPACIVWLYYASSLTMWRFPDIFFCLVCGLLEKNAQVEKKANLNNYLIIFKH